LTLLQVMNAAMAFCLAIFGVQAFILTFLYLRHRRDDLAPADMTGRVWPAVAVQLPIFNERHVVERLIDAAAGLDYPRDRLEIQVLDDSTDDTTALAETRAAYHRARGVNIRVLHRADRRGFKAGALAAGLAQTTAELLAVFDADFAPRPDFLRRVIPHFGDRPAVGMIQTRWAHLNEQYSAFTRAQSLALDAHFVVEQTGRNRSGLLINFNGSGGVWRRACIVAAGGWQSDTMTEDMDLSYRAQLAGWRSLYLPDVEAPAELPPQVDAFKQQQARWAQGSTQCLRKLGPQVLRSDLAPVQKVAALLHIASYFTHPLMLGVLLLSLPLIWAGQSVQVPLAALAFVSFAPPVLYTVAQSALHRDWPRRMLYLPVIILVGTGIAWSTSRAVWQGITRWGGTFARTPKFQLEGRQGRWADSAYRLHPDWTVIGEVALALYAAAGIVVASVRGSYGAIPFLAIYAVGFGLVAALGLGQWLIRRPVPRRDPAIGRPSVQAR
jgi:cellulose synthase/poly-beta-1,6-N-acetylglucosamine synthase-like glycosyltransferase